MRELNLPTLDYRRKRSDMIQVFKIIHQADDIKAGVFFNFAVNSGTRGQCLKFAKPKAHKSIHSNSFGHCTISTWNDLPQNVVTCSTVNSFKSQLDKSWVHKGLNLSDVY